MPTQAEIPPAVPPLEQLGRLPLVHSVFVQPQIVA
jgi:hypothetical protein